MAKEKAAKPVKAGAENKTGMAWLLVWPIILAMSAVFPPLFIFVAGVIPTLVARFVDPHPERSLTVCAGAGNAVGCVYWLIWTVTHQYLSWQSILGLMLLPTTWLVLLGATGAGWVVWLIIPSMVSAQVTQHQLAIRARLVKAQEKMSKEWNQGINAP